MSILITGGAGFIGSHLCEWYNAGGSPVTVLDNFFSGKRENFVTPEAVTVIEGDVADATVVTQLVGDAEAVFHLAAIASVQVCTQQPALATATNVAGTQTVFDAVATVQKQTGRTIPVVYASSAAIYGDNPNLPLSESETPTPISLYGEHKLENERIAARAFAEHGVRSVGLRFFNVYGARQAPSSPYSGVISKFVERAQAGQPLTIFGDGEQCRDFIYVGDIVKALVNSSTYAKTDLPFAQAPTGADIFNVGTGTATSLLLLARTLGTVLQKEGLDLDFQPAREGDIRRSLANPTALMNAYNVVHWTPLLNGLQQMLGAHA